ncbi:unnamed protein product [Merluccius merluccius]
MRRPPRSQLTHRALLAAAAGREAGRLGRASRDGCGDDGEAKVAVEPTGEKPLQIDHAGAIVGFDEDSEARRGCG